MPALTLGWRLRMAMEHAKKSRQDMADALGVSPGQVTRWTHDDGTPRRAYVAQWALITGVSVDWLETGKVSSEPSSPPPEGGDALRDLTQTKLRRTRHAGKPNTVQYAVRTLAA